jgi:hypothetical protein
VPWRFSALDESAACSSASPRALLLYERSRKMDRPNSPWLALRDWSGPHHRRVCNLLLIPLVMTADLQLQLKAALTGLLGLTPLLTKLAAVALIGGPAFNLIKRQVMRFVKARSGLPPKLRLRTAGF